MKSERSLGKYECMNNQQVEKPFNNSIIPFQHGKDNQMVHFK